VDWHLSKLYDKKSETETEVSKIGEIVFKRYYHVFKKDELEDLVNEIENIKIIKRFFISKLN
jgi:hypothetical protein